MFNSRRNQTRVTIPIRRTDWWAIIQRATGHGGLTGIQKGKPESPGRATIRSRSQPPTPGGREREKKKDTD